MRRSTCFVSLALALLTVACGESTTPSDAGAPDGGALDAGLDASAIDASIAEDGGPTDAGCDLSPEPDPLAQIMGEFAVDDPDAGSSVPVATGGDPTGTWVFEDATFYVTPGAAAMFDVESSDVTGTAWVAFEGTQVRLEFELVTTLRETIAGTLVRPSTTRIRGEYAVDGARVVIAPSCYETTAMGGGSGGGLEISVTGDEAMLVTRLSMATGMVTIVLRGTRRTTT